MKKILRFFSIVTAISTAALLVAACGEGVPVYVVGTEANLVSLKIGELPRVVENGDKSSFDIPDPIDSFYWEDELFDLAGADISSAPLERASDTQKVRLYPVVSTGARVEWGIGSQDMRPFTFYDRRVTATFEDADVLYFRVTSEDGETTQYYRFVVWVRSPVTLLSDVYIGRYVTHPEQSQTGSTTIVVDIDERMLATNLLDSPTLEAVMASTRPGVLAIREDQVAGDDGRGAEIKVIQFDSKSTVKFALVPPENDPTTGPVVSDVVPVFGTNNIFVLTDYAYLYIEVTAENRVDKAYYRFRVEVGRIASIDALTFLGAGGVEYGVANVGEQNSAWGSVKRGKFETANMPIDGFGVDYACTDPGATLTYGLVTGAVAGNNSAPASGDFNSPAKVQFDGTNVLAIKVVSKNQRATRYYKIDVTLLAANFAVQPKSAYYYNYNPALMVGNPGDGQVTWFQYNTAAFDGYTVTGSEPGVTYTTDANVVALSAKLDRTVTFDYQWYETNSWYGGYGFDADNRILYFRPEGGDPIRETGFTGTGGDSKPVPTTVNEYYVPGFDEKKNVSLHNGGNQFYRLENPGRKITGASGTGITSDTVPSYKPTIADKRPFIAGYTSESHYYWVEVKITGGDGAGRTAVSRRAVIVTERDPRKKHHILNLSDPPDPNSSLKPGTDSGGKTWPGTARNPAKFKVKRETYKIPITLPDNFNVKDYTIATVQALFFLTDGTPWIQNWTQGDIGFEDDAGTQLIYYNLTNNNGTLGLVGGGKEPNGGSLLTTPKFLIVKPAGEKPVYQKPPLEDNGVTPKPNNDAQGWFCGFIELVEVRFEGPPQED